jgi:hypothetical protein
MIKTNFEMPRGDDPVKQGQRLAQDLSSNFKAIAKQLGASSSSISAGVMPVGSIIQSMLTLAQFQSIVGTSWVLADGGSCSGSVYESITGNSTVPDARSVVLRGKDNGRGLNPAGDVALGTYQADAVYGGSTYDGGPRVLYGSSGTDYGETRMKNITVNIFIRIN